MNQHRFDEELDEFLQQVIRQSDVFPVRGDQARALVLQSERDQSQQRLQQMDAEFLKLIRGSCRGAERESLAGVLAADWNDPAWADYTPLRGSDCIPTLVRFGVLHGGGCGAPSYCIPAMAPLLGTGNLLFVAQDDEGLHRARSAVGGVLFRAVATTQPGRMHLALVDTRESGRAFLEIRRLLGAICDQPTSFWDPSAIRDLLATRVSHIERMMRDDLSDRSASLLRLVRSGRGPQTPFHILGLSAFPTGLDASCVRLIQLIAQNGPATGVHIVGVVDGRQTSAREIERVFGPHTLCVVQSAGGEFVVEHPQLSRARLDLDGLPDPSPDWMRTFASQVDSAAGVSRI